MSENQKITSISEDSKTKNIQINNNLNFDPLGSLERYIDHLTVEAKKDLENAKLARIQCQMKNTTKFHKD
jgi:hypothetical protein